MSNKWISVNERMPGGMCNKIIRAGGVTTGLAYLGFDSKWRDPYANCEVLNVTHWMDLPEPPAPLKPADPFEAWWDTQENGGMNRFWRAIDGLAIRDGAARLIWNAAKEHYERPLPGFEAWWGTLRPIPSACELRDVLARQVDLRVAQHIWNAAQGKTDG